MLKGLVPGVQSMPNESQKYKSGIWRLLEDQLPVHALACISNPIAKVTSLSYRVVWHTWVIGNDCTTIIVSPNKVNG